jgi:hypothetical protein
MNLDYLIPWDNIPKDIVAVARHDTLHGDLLLRGHYVSEGLNYNPETGGWDSEVANLLFGQSDYSVRINIPLIRFPMNLPIEQCLFIRPSVTQEKRIANLEARITALELQLKEL